MKLKTHKFFIAQNNHISKKIFFALLFLFSLSTYCKTKGVAGRIEGDSVIIKPRTVKKPNRIADNELAPAHRGVDGLVFRVQVNKPEEMNDYKEPGIREVTIEGNKSFVIGDDFTSLMKAQFFCERIKQKNKTNPRVIALYKGKRVTLEELHKMGMFKS